MQVHFLTSIKSIAFKPGSALLCALLLVGCNAKVIEPMRLTAVPGQAATRLVSEQAEPGATNYGVPDVSRVIFVTDAQAPVLDLTY